MKQHLTLKDYQEQALKTNLGTVIREPEGQAILYPVMGMVDELAEVVEKHASSLETSKEVGDVMWYYFVAMNGLVDSVDKEMLALGLELAEGTYSFQNIPALGFNSLVPLFEFQDARYSNHREFNAFSSLAFAMKCGGKALGIIKKVHRDSGGQISAEAKREVANYLTMSFYHLCHFAAYTKVDLEQAALENLAKLKSRQKRGKLHGSGDDR